MGDEVKDEVKVENAAAAELEVDSVSEEEAAEQAAFLAEMSGEQVATDAIVPENNEDEPEPKEEEVAPEGNAEPKRVEVIAGFTEDEIRENFARLDKLQRALDTTNGTLGSRIANQDKLIEKLKEQSGQRLVGTLSPKVIERLESEFPELAELLKPDAETEALIQGLETQAKFDPELVGKAVDERLQGYIAKQEAKEMERSKRLLTKRHPDWQDTAMFVKSDSGLIKWKNPQFGAFVATLPEDEQEKLVSDADIDFILDKLDAFKAAGTAKPEPKKKTNKPSLDDAVRPTGLPVSKRTLTPEQEEEEAFRKAMKE